MIEKKKRVEVGRELEETICKIVLSYIDNKDKSRAIAKEIIDALSVEREPEMEAKKPTIRVIRKEIKEMRDRTRNDTYKAGYEDGLQFAIEALKARVK